MKRLHRVETIHFFPGTNDGPATCVCSWVGLASRWDIHTGRAAPDTCPQGHDDWITRTDAQGRVTRVCKTCKNARSAAWKRGARAKAKEQREMVAA